MLIDFITMTQDLFLYQHNIILEPMYSVPITEVIEIPVH